MDTNLQQILSLSFKLKIYTASAHWLLRTYLQKELLTVNEAPKQQQKTKTTQKPLASPDFWLFSGECISAVTAALQHGTGCQKPATNLLII